MQYRSPQPIRFTTCGIGSVAIVLQIAEALPFMYQCFFRRLKLKLKLRQRK